MTNVRFDGGAFTPIPDPIQWGDGSDWDGPMRAYGFRYPQAPERIGSEYFLHLEWYGPAPAPAPCEYLCVLHDGDCGLLNVWCKDGLAFHQYLCAAAPMLIAASVSQVSEQLEQASRWIFDDYDGILSGHILSRRAANREKVKLAPGGNR